jgi:hypothetical protein
MTNLRRGGDSVSRKSPRNCRSLGFARDDKGEGELSMESGLDPAAPLDDEKDPPAGNHFLLNRNPLLCHPERSRGICSSADFSWKRVSSPPQTCHLDRTRISCHAALDMAACAAFVKESSMKCGNAIKFHRKSGGAQRSGEICRFFSCSNAGLERTR